MNSCKVNREVKSLSLIPDRTSRIYFDSTDRRSHRDFGRGILRYSGDYGGRMPFTAADADAAARIFAEDEMSDAEFDRLSDESAFLDRYVKGNVGL